MLQIYKNSRPLFMRPRKTYPVLKRERVSVGVSLSTLLLVRWLLLKNTYRVCKTGV